MIFTQVIFEFRMKQVYYFLLTCFLFFVGCSSDSGFMDDEPEEVSPVVLDLSQIPYPKLSDYNLFKSPLSDMVPVYGVLPYEPISPLFSDYASKKRFIWMPKNQIATYSGDAKTLDFPDGTILVKHFYYENVLPENVKQLLETRLMIRDQGEWLFFNYVWNEEQTEAVYDMEGSYVPITWMQDGQVKEVNYRIPNGAECLSCHNIAEVPLPIGTKPQNLNKDFDYADGIQNQLHKLKDFGYLTDFPNQIQTVRDYRDTSENLELRVRSYLDINCAHCHSEEGFCNYRAPRFAFSMTSEPENLGICIEPDENITPWVDGSPTHIIKPGNHAESSLYYRINTTLENIRMPLRGRTVIHEEGVQMITQWIDSLEPNCN